MSDQFPPATQYGSKKRGSSVSTVQWIAILAVTVLIAVVAVLVVTRSNKNSGGKGSVAGASGPATTGANSKPTKAKGDAPAGSGKVINGSGGQGTKDTDPTDTSTPTETATPTDTPTSSTSTDTTSSPTGSPSIRVFLPPRVTLSNIVVAPINGKLDYQASANYGEANLSAGFSPDPYSVGMTTGGSVNVGYLGSSCSGFATSSPDLRVNFGGGGASLLRIYFVGSNGDAAFVINDPYGNFYCVDDSFGTVNPTIDFNNPAGGTYDVWIASYAANTTVSGTLYLTENSGNHP